MTCGKTVAVAYRGGPHDPDRAYTSTYHCPLPPGHEGGGEHALPPLPRDAIITYKAATDAETGQQ